jgi:hypothetical protein
MSADELVELYMRADIGLLPYKAHSQVAMPIKFFDYVNFGLFMICSLTMEVADVISCNDLGCMYKAGDARDLYEKILAASEDRAMLRRAAARCEYLSGYYSVARQYGDFAEFVRSRAEA